MKNQYRKKPIVIEAFQMTRERRSDNSEWTEWMHQAWNMDPADENSLSCVDYPESDGTDQLQIKTLEGVMLVGWGDYIIRGVMGELYPCKESIFNATYESVDDINEKKTQQAMDNIAKLDEELGL